MLIRDIIVESYAENILEIVQDLLVMYMDKGVEDISMDEFRSQLSKQGYNAGAQEIVAAVDASGMASEVDLNHIVPTSELPTDLQGEEPVDVADMAGSQAMSDVKGGL
jgi:hypothetical protein